MDSDTELEELACADQETVQGTITIDKSWEDYASREFTMVLSKTLTNGPKVMLEAKVNSPVTVPIVLIVRMSMRACFLIMGLQLQIKISMEYPLRPPLFRLQLISENTVALKWHNDLRAMEAEVCTLYFELLSQFLFGAHLLWIHTALTTCR
jgi:THO complex subunit 5